MTGLLQSHREHTARRRITDCLETATHYREAARRTAEHQPSNWAALVQGCIERAQSEEQRAAVVAETHGLKEVMDAIR
jgi:hypothetical protein